MSIFWASAPARKRTGEEEGEQTVPLIGVVAILGRGSVGRSVRDWYFLGPVPVVARTSTVWKRNGTDLARQPNRR